MTIAARLRRRTFASLPPADARYFDTEPGTRVLAHCNWQPDRLRQPLLVALHGLEGSSESSYVRGLAEKAYLAGFNVVRLNHRNCGGTETLTPSLYHSGLTIDARAVVEELVDRDGFRQVGLAGYSLGGNVALKLAGEYGDRAPAALRFAAAVSPPIDLTAATILLERPRNRIYQWYFLASLKRRIVRKAQMFPGRYSTDGLGRIRTIRAFDDRYTAPDAGYGNAEDYYDRASCIHAIPRIAVPTLIISASDDPFIPTGPFGDPRVGGNPNVEVVITSHGGHCGFIGQRCTEHDGYWAEWAVVRWAGAVLQNSEFRIRNSEGGCGFAE
ncbi:MAG: YheT family hydrolase [Bacteroidales bacterium]